METIIPRWEWRTFGTELGSAETTLAALTPEATTESDELYFLAQGGVNVKVRYDLLDIKVLEEIDADGLERWMPVMKAAFPLSRADAARVFTALGITGPASGRDTYSLDHLVDELTGPGTDVRAVEVHKRRVRYTIGGCAGELTDVAADGHPIRTIAVESENKEAVLAAVRDLGLDTYINTNYLRGLARALSDVPDRYAVIDVGTNSVKFHLGERADDGSWTTLMDRAEVTRLGEGLEENREILPEAVERTAAAIEDMVNEAKENDAVAIAAVATAGMRIATNRDDVTASIRARTGVTIEVISGDTESRLAYVAVQAGLGLGDGSLVVFDTGGGSSQFTFGTGSRVDERFSVNVGAVRYTEQFGLDGVVSPKVLSDAIDAISADLTSIAGRPVPDAMVGMGGAITNITAVSLEMATYDPDIVQGSILARDEIDRQIEMYRSLDATGRRSIVGLQPNRADVILAGACIVRTVMESLGQQTLTVSDRGLRHGVAIERYGAQLSP